MCPFVVHRLFFFVDPWTAREPDIAPRPDASRLGTRSRCLACSTERVRRRIYLLRRANLTMSGVRAGPPQRAFRLIAPSSSPNRPLQPRLMSVPTTAKYNVITAWRCIGDACRGHVCAAHGSCLHSCLRCSTTPPAKEDLEAGQLISHASTTIRLSALVLEGHRFAVAPIGLGELITSWGEPFRCLACSTERLRQRIWPPQRAFRFGALLSRRSTPSSRDGVE